MQPVNSTWNKPLGHNQNEGDDHVNGNGQHANGDAPEAFGAGAKSGVPTMNYKEVQQDEVDALQAIYFDGFEELENNNIAWNVC